MHYIGKSGFEETQESMRLFYLFSGSLFRHIWIRENPNNHDLYDTEQRGSGGCDGVDQLDLIKKLHGANTGCSRTQNL